MGTLGITTGSLCRAFGSEPHVFSNQKVSGFSSVFRKEHPAAGFLEKMGDLAGADLVVNTSNLWSDHRLSLQIARKGGTIVYLAFPGRGTQAPDFNPLDSQFFYDKQLALKHCGHVTEGDPPPIDARYTLKRNMGYLAGLILSGRIDPTEIISTEASWDGLDAVYGALESRKAGMHSAIIRWDA